MREDVSKLPSNISTIQWTGDNQEDVVRFMHDRWRTPEPVYADGEGCGKVRVLDDGVADIGDWIVYEGGRMVCYSQEEMSARLLDQ